MNRVQAMTYLQNEYAELATDAQFSDTQTATAYSVALDMSLRQLGYTEDQLSTTDVPQAQILSYIALMNYYALKRFQRLLSTRVDVKIGQNTLDAQRNQAFTSVSKLLEEAKSELLSLNISLTGPSLEIGRINLDFNEPGFTGSLAGLDDWLWGGF